LIHAETARGPHNFLYCYIKVNRKRVEQIEKIFADYDQEVPESMRIKLTNLPCEPALVGFGRGKDFERHVIYKEIKKIEQEDPSNYKLWSPALAKSQAEREELARVRASFAYETVDDGEDTEDDESLDEAPPPPPRVAAPTPRQAGPRVKPSPAAAGQPSQTKIEEFFKRADEKLDRIDNFNHENAKSVAGSLLEIVTFSHENAKSVSSCLVEVNDNMVECLDDVKKNGAKLDNMMQATADVKQIVEKLFENKDENAKLLEKADHFENMSYRLRGKLGSQAVQENKPLHAEISSLKRKLEVEKAQNKRLSKQFGRIETKLDELLSRP